MRTRPICAGLLAICALIGPNSAGAQGPSQPPPGLSVRDDGVLLLAGKPFRGIGVNYFDAFHRHLMDPTNTTYEQGFAALAEAGIPFARIIGGGFWPVEQRLYLDNPDEFFRRFDAVIRAAEQYGIGLIPSLFWNVATVPDLVGEPVSEWGNPQSLTHAHMRQYVRDVVTRYLNSPAIWGWEFGNEFNLGANLPNASEHRPAVWPTLGTATSRSEKDEWTYETVRTAFAAFAAEVRRYDPHRIISSGDGFPRTCAWHNWREGTWQEDTPEQFAQMLVDNNPDPVNVISVHAYADDVARIHDAAAIARSVKKPLFVGEFGAPGPREESEHTFRELLTAIIESGAPLAALWVYDRGEDDPFTVTATNARAYQLAALSEANAHLRQQTSSE